MEFGNRAVGVVFVALLIGAFGYLYRENLTNLFRHSAPQALKTGDVSLADGGRVVVEAFGKPYIGEDALNNKLQQMLQSSQVTRSMDPAMLPPIAKLNFLKDWVNFLLIKDIWGKQHDIEHDAAFQKRLKDATEALRDSLIIDSFVQDLKKTISVSEDEVLAEYQANKEHYVKAPGGVQCCVVEFDDAPAARSLLQDAQDVTTSADFKDLVDKAGAGKIVDLGFVNDRSGAGNPALSRLPQEVRRAVLGKHAEAAVLVPVAETYFVVFKAERKAPQYHTVEHVAPHIKSRLEETKQREALDNALEQLRSKADLVFKTDVLGLPDDSQQGVLSKEELAAALQADDASFADDDVVVDDAN